MPRLSFSIRISALLVWSISLATADVLVYPAAKDEPLSTVFTVSVNQSNSPVYLAKVTTTDSIPDIKTKGPDETSVTSFDMNGNADVSVTCSEPVTSVKLLPTSCGIIPVASGKTVTFTITKPGQFVLEINGNWVNSLQLFANPWETDVPKEGDPNVIYFGPGVHQVDPIIVSSGKTLYLAGGAILYGKNTPGVPGKAVVTLEGDNITLRGRGILDGGLCPPHTKNLLAVHGNNISVEGITLRDSSTWTVPARKCDHLKIENLKIFGYRGNSDGIDICNCTNVDVSDCYLRTWDDLVVIKSDLGQGEVHDVNVKHCVLWNELAHALSIGAELRENVSRVHFSDCDVIHDKGREWVLRVYHCDAAHISDVTFDNIRIEEARRLISLWIGKAIWSKQADRGHIDNITFSNISAVGPKPLVDLLGFDADHAINGVKFDHVVVNGQPLVLAAVKQNGFVQGVNVVP